MTMPTVETLPRESTCARPFLKWVGGKGKLFAQLKPLFPQKFGNYYEPFMGSAAVFFSLRPTGKTYLSDSNRELVTTFKQVQKNSAELAAALKRHRDGHARGGKDYYYRIRKLDPNPVTNPIELAARFIYLNKTCFNGLYRVNLKGKYNVPMGAYKNPPIYDADLLAQASLALQDVDIRTARFDDFEGREPRANDFIYFDPPYVPLSSASNFTSYTRDSFGPNEQEGLRELCKDLSDRGCYVVQSNSNSPEIRKMYSGLRGFRIEEVSARRLINSVASKRGAIKEVVITNA